MYRVYSSEKHSRVERFIYRVIGANPKSEQIWASYARSVLAFSAVSILFLFVLAARAGQAAAASERSSDADDAGAGLEHRGQLRHQHQLAVLLRRVDAWATWRRWPVWRCRTSSRPPSASPSRSRWSAGSPARAPTELGNFWVDLVRGIAADPAADLGRRRVRLRRAAARSRTSTCTTTSSPRSPAAQQTITGGPVASQEAIKELGTNGGGFFNANSAHPFENPTAWTNWLEIFLLLVISFSLPRTFGRMVGDKRQGCAIVAVMARLLPSSASLCMMRLPVARTTAPSRTAVGAATGGQRAAVRRRRLGAVRRRDDAHVDRRGQLLPRLATPASAAW